MNGNWLDKNGWLVVSALIVVGLAAFAAAQSGPAFFGHSSDEIALVFVTVSKDCTGQASFDCQVTCPGDPSATTTYRAIGGNCLSQSGDRWGSMGVISTLNGWQCMDNSYSGVGQFAASVMCIEVGK